MKHETFMMKAQGIVIPDGYHKEPGRRVSGNIKLSVVSFLSS